MPKANSKDKPHLYLLSEVNVAEPTGDGKTMPRAFSGVANSGLPFNYGGERAIVDLDDLSYHDPVPVLIEHERSQRAGFGTLTVKDNQLAIEGKLLDNVHGNAVADDADADFPWQMSAHVIAGEIDKLKTGETVVNGHTVTAPILILRQCRIPEVSFTPTGVDSETSAVVLSDSLKQQATLANQTNTPTEPKDTDMTLEQALAKIAEQDKLIAEKDKTIETLKAEKQELIDEKEALAKEKHEADVEAQLSQAGFSKSEDGKTWQGVSKGTINVLLSADTESAKAIIADLKPKSDNQNAMPDVLLGEQYQPTADGVKLSNNPLLAAAESRNQ